VSARTILGASAAAVVMAACGSSGNDAPAAKGADSASAPTAPAASTAPKVQGEPLALPSGRRVVVLGSGPVRFTQGAPALMIRYATELSVDDTVPLAREAEEVFQAYRQRAEAAKLNGLVASAFEMPRGGGSGQQARGYNFSWTRDGSGLWHRH
jgi:hypothetical protein